MKHLINKLEIATNLEIERTTLTMTSIFGLIMQIDLGDNARVFFFNQLRLLILLKSCKVQISTDCLLKNDMPIYK